MRRRFSVGHRLTLAAMLNRLRIRLADDRGIALVMALGMIVVLTISVTTTMYLTSTNSRSAGVSKDRSTAYFLAEAGINNAMAILAKPLNNALDKYVLCADAASNPTLPCVHSPTDNPATTGYNEADPTTTVYKEGTVTWSGTFTTNPAVGSAWWVVTSTGYVRNPTSPTAPQLKRTLTATIQIVPTTSQPLNNPSWDYIFVRAPGWTGQALNGCDMTLQQSVNVTANLYVLGNLCFQNTAKMSSGKLYVKGSVDMQQSANKVGTSTVPISQMHVGLGCRYLSQSRHNPCVQGAGGGAGTMDNVWATQLDNTVTAITPPTVEWDGWYLNANPGPYFPCDPAYNLPGDPSRPSWNLDSPVAAMADSDANKLLFRNDNQGVINLTPSTSYKCKTMGGEISWDAVNKVLTVAGTIFIDGSATIQNGAVNLYKGSATLYLWGTFLMKGGGQSTKLCPYSTGTACNTSQWDTQADLLGIVAHGNGSVPADSQVSAGDSVQFVSSYFMGAVYAQNAIDVGTTSIVDGPMDGAYVNLGQSATSTFSGFTYVPVGLPGEQTVYAEPQKPVFSGG
jgi:Tfp pilus assembly protein PilX